MGEGWEGIDQEDSIWDAADGNKAPAGCPSVASTLSRGYWRRTSEKAKRTKSNLGGGRRTSQPDSTYHVSSSPGPQASGGK